MVDAVDAATLPADLRQLMHASNKITARRRSYTALVQTLICIGSLTQEPDSLILIYSLAERLHIVVISDRLSFYQGIIFGPASPGYGNVRT